MKDIISNNQPNKKEWIDNENYPTLTNYSDCYIDGTDLISGSSVENIVQIPLGVETIGKRAFCGYSRLTCVVIPDTVECIEAEAFKDCVSLTEIVLPGSVYRICESAFENCKKLSVVILERGIKRIDDFAFSNCISLASINIPDSVTNIGNAVFYGCSSLMSISIPSSVLYIGAGESKYAPGIFEECDNLQYNEYDNGLYLGNENNNYAFFIKTKSPNITSCVINPNTKHILPKAFWCCKSLKCLDIPKTVTNIGHYAFESCFSLKRIFIPNSVKCMGTRVFSHCDKLVIYCEKKERTYEWFNDWHYDCKFYNVIWGCSLIDEIIYKIDNNVAGIVKCDENTRGELEIPHVVTHFDKQYYVAYIEKEAFSNCSGISSITIPDSVDRIGCQAFSNCNNLTHVNFNGTKKQWKIIAKTSKKVYHWKPSINGCEITCTDGVIKK